MMNSKKPILTVAYIFLSYPSLHKTFVDREIFALREQGIHITIYSLQHSNTILSPYQKEIKKEIIYVSDYPLSKVIAGNLTAIRHKTRKYFSTLFYLLTRPHPRGLSRRRTLLYFFRSVFFTTLLEQNPPDHIHAHFLNESVTAALVAQRLLGIPYSATVHASSELFVTPRMIQAKLSEAKFIATCTDYNRDYLENVSKGQFDRKLKVIYHGLDSNLYQRKHSPQEGTPVIVGVGQLRERKGYQVLVDACAILKQRGINFQCRIIGEGPMRSLLEEKIKQQGLEEHVILLGALSQDDVIEQYQQASIFTLPAVLASDGDRDGIPNVILEAMAMQLPVVSTRHSAIPEVINDRENGLLVPPDDALALANSLMELINNPGLRSSLGNLGRQTVIAKFDPQKNANLLIRAIAGEPAGNR